MNRSFPNRQRKRADERGEGEESEVHACPECDSTDLVPQSKRGEIVCGDCGLVVDDTVVDRGPEWRAFTSDERERRARVGPPATLLQHDKGLTTTIDWKSEDARGRPLPPEKRRRVQRMRTWQERIRTKDAGERNLQFALAEINRMASALGVPTSVRQVASVIYRRALDDDLIMGRSIEGMASAALYTACRREDVPRSLDEVSIVSRVTYREIGRAYRYLSAELDLEMEPVDPKQYVPRFASELDLSENVVAKANEIIDVSANEGLISGRSPTGIGAGAIYAASLLCNEKRTQEQVADATQVSTVTIRSRYQEQIEAMGIT